MTIIRDYFAGFKQTDFVDAVSEVGNQYGLINSMGGLFNAKSTSMTSVVFDKDYQTTTLLPQVKRGDYSSTQGKERTAETFALALPYFKHADRLTTEDIQGHRKVGSTEVQDIASATAEKMVDMRRQKDMTFEYMKIQALKGITKSPDGAVIANSFTEFGATQKSIDFLLGSPSTNIDAKISEMKRHIASNVKNGGAIGGVKVLVDNSFFDKLISHANIKSSYNYYQNNGMQVNREDTANYLAWGCTDSFTHRGVTFLAYDASFNLPNGTTEVAFAANTGLAFADGVSDLFRAYYGPSHKLSAANQAGSELFMQSYLDPRDNFIEFEMETSPLFLCMRPQSLVALTTSN